VSCYCHDLIKFDEKMPIIFEKDIDKYYDEKELTLMKRGSGLFPAGHYPRKERSGNGFADILASGARLFKVISDNKETIKNVGQAVSSVVKAGTEIKNAIKSTPPKTTLPEIQPLAPPAESVDPEIYKRLRESVKNGSGFKHD
jgi:hypothetical protein